MPPSGFEMRLSVYVEIGGDRSLVLCHCETAVSHNQNAVGNILVRDPHELDISIDIDIEGHGIQSGLTLIFIITNFTFI